MPAAGYPKTGIENYASIFFRYKMQFAALKSSG